MKALMRGIAAVKPGATTGDIGAAIQAYAESRALLRGARFLRPRPRPRCSTTQPNILHYGEPGEGVPLKPGMIFTIEPMINLGRPHVKILSDGWTAVTRDRSLSAQFEHTVGVTETGCEIFTLSPRGLRPRRSLRASHRAKAECGFEAMRRKPHYLGHRERLRERFREAGADALPDYELLELVLFRAVPRRDIKPLAKALIARFGSFAEAHRRRRRELLPRCRASARRAITELKIVEAAAPALRQRRGAASAPVLGSWSALIDYCRAAMAFAEQGEFRILFLDKRNRLIADEVQQTGTVDHTPVYPREVVKRALELSATALILVHNHPSGDPTPSRADIEMTKQIVDGGEAARRRWCTTTSSSASRATRSFRGLTGRTRPHKRQACPDMAQARPNECRFHCGLSPITL